MKKILLFTLLLIQLSQLFAQNNEIIVNNLYENSFYSKSIIVNNKLLKYDNIEASYFIKVNDTIVFIKNKLIYNDNFKIITPENISLIQIINKNCIIFSTYTNKIYKSIDFGKSWFIIYENLINRSHFLNMSFNNINEGIINIVEVNEKTGEHLKKILYTKNNGKNWNISDNTNIKYIIAITYKDNISYIYNLNGDFYKSIDFGKSWILIKNINLDDIKYIKINDSLLKSTELYPFILYKIL